MKRKKRQPSQRKSHNAKHEQTFQTQIDRALDLLNRYALEEGYQLIQELALHYPEHQEVQYAFGAYHLLKGELRQAVEHFERATALKPDFAQAYFNKAAVYKQLMEIKPTIRAFQQVVKYGDPQQGYVQQAHDFLTDFEKLVGDHEGVSLDTYLRGGDEFDRGVECSRQHDWHTAIGHFMHSAALTPRHPQTFCNLGICYLQLGCRSEALDAFDKALEIDPHYELARLNRQMAVSLREGEKPSPDLPFINYYAETWKKYV